MARESKYSSALKTSEECLLRQVLDGVALSGGPPDDRTDHSHVGLDERRAGLLVAGQACLDEVPIVTGALRLPVTPG